MAQAESFFAGGLDDATRAVVERALSGGGGYACLANAHVLVAADSDGDLRRALAGAWAVFPDGWPVAWLQRRLGVNGATRIPGPDLMPTVVGAGCDAGVRHFLFGSTDDVLDALERSLVRRFPSVRIVGRLAPPFGHIDGTAVATIRASSPDVVWCGFGAPKQELWMSRYAEELTPAVVLGVGAAFDFLAGTRRRAPLVVQRLGLEWLHRLISEPRRLWRRYLVGNSRFLVLALRLLGKRLTATRGR